MTNPIEVLKAQIDHLLSKGLKSLHILILEEDVKSNLSRLSVLVLPDEDAAKRYLRMIRYMESDGTVSGDVGAFDISATTPPPQRPPDTTP